MPPKGSIELNKKNGFLGQFQKNKKHISKMEVMILEQETEFKNTENQMKEMTNGINLRKKWNKTNENWNGKLEWKNKNYFKWNKQQKEKIVTQKYDFK